MMQISHQMRGVAARLKQLIRDFDDESGATTVEFVLWVPVFMFILMITVDVSLLFLRQSNLWQVARDTARQVSIRHWGANNAIVVTEAEAYAVANGTFSGDVPTAKVVITEGTQRVQVQLAVPMSEVGVFGIFKIGGQVISVGQTGNLTALVTHRLEPL